MIPLFAAVTVNSGGSGEGLVKDVLWIFALICIALIVWGLGRYFFPKLSAPPLVMTIWDGVFILIGALVAINFILGLFGHPLIRW